MHTSQARRHADTRRHQRVYLSPHVTGYPRTICINPRVQARYGPRVSFQDARQRWVAISIAEDPHVLTPARYTLSAQELRLARWFILLNRQALVAYWDGRVTDPHVWKSTLQPVTENPCKQYRFSSFALAPYTTESTGVQRPVIIIGDDDQHAIPVIRVDLGSRTFATLTIDEDPQIVQGQLSPADEEEVTRFIQLNRGILLDYWYLRIGIDTLGDNMQKINEHGQRSECP